MPQRSHESDEIALQLKNLETKNKLWRVKYLAMIQFLVAQSLRGSRSADLAAQARAHAQACRRVMDLPARTGDTHLRYVPFLQFTQGDRRWVCAMANLLRSDSGVALADKSLFRCHVLVEDVLISEAKLDECGSCVAVKRAGRRECCVGGALSGCVLIR